MSFRLNWNVKKNKDGSFLRRRLEGDVMTDLEYIDVEWTHADGFPADTVLRPVTHPPDEEYEEQKVGTRKVIRDQLSVPPGVSDGTVSMMLDEKRKRLAESLGVQP